MQTPPSPPGIRPRGGLQCGEHLTVQEDEDRVALDLHLRTMPDGTVMVNRPNPLGQYQQSTSDGSIVVQQQYLMPQARRAFPLYSEFMHIEDEIIPPEDEGVLKRDWRERYHEDL